MGLLNDCLYENNMAKNEDLRAVEAIIDRKDAFNTNDTLEFSIENLPSLQEQKRIVETLDKFDALCNDETSGLAAEIAARKKQYEYYRDKLLTFKRKAS